MAHAKVLHLIEVTRKWASRCGLNQDLEDAAVALAWYAWMRRSQDFPASTWANWAVKQALSGRDLPGVKGHAVQLQQVILNLVVNAVDAMRTVQPRLLTIVSRRSDGGMIEVSVADTGTGIDPADRERVFQSLFTTKASGMGMGLSICRSIIEGHGGRVWAANGSERGSIFRFQLPAMRRRREASALARASDPVL